MKKAFTKGGTLMDIVSLVETFLKSIFEAKEMFFEKPEDLASFEQLISDASNKMAADFIGMSLTELDSYLMANSKRQERFIVQRKRERNMISTVGDLCFERTYCKDVETGEYRYLLDEIIKQPKHERFTPLAEAKAIYDSTVYSYQDAADRLTVGEQSVTKSAIKDKEHNIPEDVLEEMEKRQMPSQKKCVDYLYIEADEDHIHRQDKSVSDGCIMGKLIYVFEGKESVREGKRILISPHYFGGIYAGSDPNRFLWESVQRYIAGHYEEDFLKKVYISSDGGGWIKASKEYIDKGVLVADRFHLMKYINRVSNYMLDESDITKERFYKYIYQNKLLAAKKLLTRIKNSAGHDEVIEQTRVYFENNWEEIQRAFHDRNVYGCSAEGHVSNVYSDRMSSRPMGWSEVGSDRMCKLRCFVRNYGKAKVINLVEYRREKELLKYKATGTEDIVPVTPKRKYTKEQLEILSYADKMYVSLSGMTVKKTLAIRERLSDI